MVEEMVYNMNVNVFGRYCGLRVDFIKDIDIGIWIV